MRFFRLYPSRNTAFCIRWHSAVLGVAATVTCEPRHSQHEHACDCRQSRRDRRPRAAIFATPAPHVVSRLLFSEFGTHLDGRVSAGTPLVCAQPSTHRQSVWKAGDAIVAAVCRVCRVWLGEQAEQPCLRPFASNLTPLDLDDECDVLII